MSLSPLCPATGCWTRPHPGQITSSAGIIVEKDDADERKFKLLIVEERRWGLSQMSRPDTVHSIVNPQN
jgi:hypothetical protein